MLARQVLFAFLLFMVNACELADSHESYSWEKSKIYCAYTDRGNSYQTIPAVALSVLLLDKLDITEAVFSLEDSSKHFKFPLIVNGCKILKKNLKICGLSFSMESAQKFIKLNYENTCGYSELEKICNDYKLMLSYKEVIREIPKGRGYKNIDARILE